MLKPISSLEGLTPEALANFKTMTSVVTLVYGGFALSAASASLLVALPFTILTIMPVTAFILIEKQQAANAASAAKQVDTTPPPVAEKTNETATNLFRSPIFWRAGYAVSIAAVIVGFPHVAVIAALASTATLIRADVLRN